ncbi:hypothetical protein Afil01_60880 [Actinorhabdospora filicis]|uniref:Uncharacterized protein n=1 Tax=Actinorhabdospora filicis TaxID=1785913 RepID=A0A9W6SV27_9ACTN|nr:hypothetical protein [Actinorhabdospora filicis]GLZ81281.1 hypothetical protein Afil01_60880 [Actinorhabdospora filicis]
MQSATPAATDRVDALPTAARRTVIGLNLLGAATATISAVLGLVNPGVFGADQITDWVTFYAGAYAARAIPLGIVMWVVLLTPALRTRKTVTVLAVVAGAAQLGDIVVGATHGIPGMMAGAALGAAMHFVSLIWLRRR